MLKWLKKSLIINKIKYINELIRDYKNNREKFLDEHNFAICYDEEMV